MPTRATVADVRMSRFPIVLGKCNTDAAAIVPVLNEVTQRLLQEGGETGWVNCWKRVAFSVNSTNPYITLPRQFARCINLDVCKTPIRIFNAFYEFLPGGVGLKSPADCADWCGSVAGYEREAVATMVDITSTDQVVRVFATDSRDVGKRIMLTGLDQNGNQISSQDGTKTVSGTFLTFAQPFTTTAFKISQIQAIQKDFTFGDILVYQVDTHTGKSVLLARLQPTESNPSYRRYYISALPPNCCNSGSVATITALVKLEFIPVYQDTDQLIITNIPALIEEAQALRYSTMDTPTAAGLEEKHHRRAIKLLQDEQRHAQGSQEMSVVCNPFFGAELSAQGIGTLT